MSVFLGSGSTLFEIRAGAGNTDMLIRGTYLGKALAQSLGSSNCVLMRGHGSTTIAPSIELADTARFTVRSMPSCKFRQRRWAPSTF